MLHALASSESVRLSMSPLSPPQLSVVPVRIQAVPDTSPRSVFTAQTNKSWSAPRGAPSASENSSAHSCLWCRLSSGLILLVLGSTFSFTGFRIVHDSSCQQRWSLSFAFLVSSDFIEENKVFILPSLIVRILSLISYWFLIVSVSKSELFLISPSSSKAIF